MKQKTTIGLIASFLAVLMLVTPVFAGGKLYGCTPGFWKRHTEYWPMSIRPDDYLFEHFVEAAIYDLENFTVLEALSFKGGRSAVGGARILLRTASAALINALAFGVYPDGYLYSVDQIIGYTNDALRSGDRDYMLYHAFWFDFYNNQYCPF